MAKQHKVIALALAGVCGLGVYKLGSALLSDDAQRTEHAVNQLWIDHAPRDDRDIFMHMIILDHPQGQYGVIGQSSQWRHAIEVFRWELMGDKLRLYFPQERARGEVTIRTWECKGEAPAPFELCMELTNANGRSIRLYSREEWKVEPRDATDSLADILDDEPALAGLAGILDDANADAERVDALDLDQAQSWPESVRVQF